MGVSSDTAWIGRVPPEIYPTRVFYRKGAEAIQNRSVNLSIRDKNEQKSAHAIENKGERFAERAKAKETTYSAT